jgi:hypothetical protein
MILSSFSTTRTCARPTGPAPTIITSVVKMTSFASPARALCPRCLETSQTIAVIWPVTVVGSNRFPWRVPFVGKTINHNIPTPDIVVFKGDCYIITDRLAQITYLSRPVAERLLVSRFKSTN